MDRFRQAFHDWTNGQNLSAEQIVHVLLVMTLVAATVHLITMLATRWGDRHIGPKSLAASILVHAVCLLGLTSSTAFDVMPRASADEEKKIEQQQVQIRQLVVEAEREVKDDEQGNVPIFEQVKDDNQELERIDRESPTYDTAAVPERKPDENTLSSVPLKDVVKSERAPEAPSMPEDAGEKGQRQTAVAELQADDDIVEARSEVTPNTPSRTTNRARAGSEDLQVTRAVPRGSVSQLDKMFRDEDVAPQMEERESGTFAVPEKAEDVVSRATGPTPAETEINDAGADTEKGETGAAGAMSNAQIAAMRARRSKRTGRALDEKVEREARTDVPLDKGFDVRESPAANPMADSVDFVPAPMLSDAIEVRRRPKISATYQLRSLDQRKAVARRNGGTEESEKAVESSLKWLASAQRPEGNWSAIEFGSGQMRQDVRKDGMKVNLAKKLPGLDEYDQPAGSRADTGVTALAVLAFLGAGYTHEEGAYTDTVNRAIRWLIAQQDKDGCLSGNATYFARNYCHAMATYALAEATGMQSDVNADMDLRLALMRAVSYTSKIQDPTTGGWRYLPNKEQPAEFQDGDVSMFGWQMMALKSAEIAGIPINETVRNRMGRFLKARRLGRYGGLASYRAKDKSDKTMTAEAMFCRMMLGYKRDGEDMREAVRYLMRVTPNRADTNLYYWYYGTLSMFQYGGKAWETWNEDVRELLVDEQIRSGEFAGTWDPRKTRWGKAGGRVYTTAIATLTLEVYYRFLPLYRAAAPPEDDRGE